MTSTSTKPRIFITGGTGYIGGSFLHLMLERDYLSRFDIAVLVRNSRTAAYLNGLGVEPVVGSLDDSNLLRQQAMRAQIVFNTANCDHQSSAAALIQGLAEQSKATGERPILIHTSGAGVLSDTSTGMGLAPQDDVKAVVWDDANPAPHEAIPDHAPHQFVDIEIFAGARSGLIKTYLVVPPTVFGIGLGPLAENRMSIQVPRLVQQSLMSRKAMYVGTGENVWPNVHVADLAELYLLLLDAALKGEAPEGLKGLYYPATEHFTWITLAQKIGQVLHAQRYISSPVPAPGLRGGWFFGSNVRVLSTNENALGWNPVNGGTEAMLAGIENDLALVLK